MQEQEKLERFELTVLPHFREAYGLARWLTRNEQDAEDVVQEAYLRAFRFFDGVRGIDCRPWLFTIVRNTYYTWRKRSRHHVNVIALDEHVEERADAVSDPDVKLLQSVDTDRLRRCIDLLPAEYREVLLLREFEDLSYKEIATVTGLPLGTVMSRLSRARGRLQACVIACSKEGSNDLQ